MEAYYIIGSAPILDKCEMKINLDEIIAGRRI